MRPKRPVDYPAKAAGRRASRTVARRPADVVRTERAARVVDRPYLTIGTVAGRLGVSVQTLRLYEDRGLILVEKSPGGQRRYSESDVDRLACIRTAITEQKISLEGIRRLQALVPCWHYVQCPMTERRACAAYLTPVAGCWAHEHRSNACTAADCRRCVVYRLSSDCESIKALVHGTPRTQIRKTRPPHKDSAA